MDFKKLVYERRTIRRFSQKTVSVDLLKELVDYARVAPMGNNLQSLEYLIVVDKNQREKIFPLLSWAGSLPAEMRTPAEGRRPMAYIIVLVNTEIKKKPFYDVGAAVENILLGAADKGLGACWMGSIEREELRSLMKIPEKYDISHVISLGYPDEVSTIEPFEDSFKYWKDDEGQMHVPKKSLDDIIFNII